MAEPAAQTDPGAAPPAWAQALAEARARGLDRRAPLHWQRIAALAHRTERKPAGAVRQRLEARLRDLLAELDGLPPVDVPAPRPAPAQPGPLAALIAPLQASAPAVHADPAAPAPAAAAPELKVVQRHRASWARLRAEQQLAQAHTALPGQAGPLNSQRLLLRALTLMRETAPEYLQHFLHQAGALAWLEQAQQPPAVAPREGAPRSPKAAKPGGRTRSR